MRIIFTTHTYYPSRDGVANVNEYLTNGLVSKGHEVIVITHYKNGLPIEENHNGIHVYRIYKDSEPKEYISFVKTFVHYDDVLINICLQTPTTDLLLESLDDIKCKKKLLYVHGIWHFPWDKRNYKDIHSILSKIYNNSKWRWYYLKLRKTISAYDDIIQLHDKDEGYLFFQKYYKIDCKIIENAGDDVFFTSEEGIDFLEKYKLNMKYIVCVSNYGPTKNPKLVLEAFIDSEVAKSQTEMIFVGKHNDGYVDMLNTLLEEAKLEKPYLKVRFLQDIERGDISKFVKHASLFAFGSIGEKFPVAIIETMAAGVPFISTDVGVVRYLPGGVVIHNKEEMIFEMDRLSNDIETYNKMSKDGRDYAINHFRISDKVDALNRIIMG